MQTPVGIDPAASAQVWLLGLDKAQRPESRGAGISLVIIDTAYLPRLLGTSKGPYLRQHLRLMRGTPWVRHDEHYHVDFSLPCKPM